MTSRNVLFAAFSGALLLASLVPPSAGAATQIGQTFSPNTGCTDLQTQFQTSWTGTAYAAPSRGIITSWSFMAAAGTPPQLKLKVARQASGNDYTIVGESVLQAPTPSVLNTFPTRIAVEAGDVIGFYNNTALGGQCGALSTGGPYGVHNKFEDVPPGTTATFNTSGFRLDVSALVEPDDDCDGFGDETQDASIDPNGCDTSPPETQITKGPKDKTRKKNASFEFNSTEAASTFECSLDGEAFEPCASPATEKVKKGKHSFRVRATDAAGNVDASPASDDWKVKKRKR